MPDRMITRRSLLALAAGGVVSLPSAALAAGRRRDRYRPYLRVPGGSNLWSRGRDGWGLPALLGVAAFGVALYVLSTLLGRRRKRETTRVVRRWRRRSARSESARRWRRHASLDRS